MTDKIYEFRVRGEVDVSVEQLDVRLSSWALDDLILQLQRLRQQKNDHFHLFTEDWGTGPLTNAPPSSRTFNMVTFHHWSGEE